MRRYGVLIVALLFLPCTALFGQEGPPPFENFLPDTYNGGAENFAAVQDNRGMLYVANSSGVLEFDGQRWNRIALPGGKGASTVAVSDSGRVYVGGEGEFGYLRPDSRGNIIYKSLSKGVAKASEAGPVTRIYVYPQGVFFSSAKGVFRFDGHNVAPVSLAKGRPTLGGDPLLLVEGRPFRFVQDKLVRLALPVRVGKEKADTVFTAILPYGRGQWLVATQQALFLYNGSRYRKVETKADKLFEANRISSVAVLDRGAIAVGTMRGGVIFISADGKLRTMLNLQSGLPTETIEGLFRDNQDGLWVLLEKGITRVELNAPVSAFAENDGLEGDVNDILRHNQSLYVATQRGLYFLSTTDLRAEFKPIKGIVTSTVSLAVVNNKVYAATSNGLYEVIKDSSAQRYAGPLLAMHQMRYQPTRLIASGPNGMVMLIPGRDSARTRHWHTPQLSHVEAINEDNHGLLMVQTRKGLYRMYFPTGADSIPKYYNVSNREPAVATNSVQMFRMFDQLMFGTAMGLYRFDAKKERFVRDSTLGPRWLGRKVNYAAKLSKGRVVVNSAGRIYLGTWKNNAFEWSDKEFANFTGIRLTQVFPELDWQGKIIWLGHAEGVLRFDPTVKKSYEYTFFTLLRAVGLGPQDSLLFGGAFRGKREDYVGLQQDSVSISMSRIENGFGRIHFEFSAPAFDLHSANQYRYKLEGSDSVWSEWSTTSSADYSNLPVGDYIFRSQARNIYGQEGQEASFAFTVEPLWYETWWALTLFVLLGLAFFIGAVYLAVKANSYRLRVANERLQYLVDERTAELQSANNQLQESNVEITRQKEEIEEDKKIIEEKNEEIKESIVYASRIQKALLPPVETIRKRLPNTFVLLRPRDIVSGDFYWYAQVDGMTLIAAADCTGHGVPGAFMTMIGNTLLNEIVQRDRITMPDQILNRLHVGVRKALSQERTSVRDGMDITFLAFDFAKGKVHYAAANNALLLVRGGVAERVPADKQAIGGSQDEDERIFTPHILDILPGDTYYLFSDGFQDQFGGPKGRKFMSLKFHELLLQLSTQTMDQQREALNEAFVNWLGTEYHQIDDVLVVGIHIPADGTPITEAAEAIRSELSMAKEKV